MITRQLLIGSLPVEHHLDAGRRASLKTHHCAKMEVEPNGSS